jgi:hypothetical protein
MFLVMPHPYPKQKNDNIYNMPRKKCHLSLKCVAIHLTSISTQLKYLKIHNVKMTNFKFLSKAVQMVTLVEYETLLTLGTYVCTC